LSLFKRCLNLSCGLPPGCDQATDLPLRLPIPAVPQAKQGLHVGVPEVPSRSIVAFSRAPTAEEDLAWCIDFIWIDP
jgi:hypothetical protein